MSKQRTRRSISRDRVYKYWSSRLDELGETPSGESVIDITMCFACGNPRGLNVAHIIPRAFGGSDELNNLHILCRLCHAESEGLRKYWEWFKWKRKNEYQHMAGHIFDYFEKCGVEMLPSEFYKDPEGNAKKILAEVFWECS